MNVSIKRVNVNVFITNENCGITFKIVQFVFSLHKKHQQFNILWIYQKIFWRKISLWSYSHIPDESHAGVSRAHLLRGNTPIKLFILCKDFFWNSSNVVLIVQIMFTSLTWGLKLCFSNIFPSKSLTTFRRHNSYTCSSLKTLSWRQKVLCNKNIANKIKWMSYSYNDAKIIFVKQLFSGFVARVIKLGVLPLQGARFTRTTG